MSFFAYFGLILKIYSFVEVALPYQCVPWKKTQSHFWSYFENIFVFGGRAAISVYSLDEKLNNIFGVFLKIKTTSIISFALYSQFFTCLDQFFFSTKITAVFSKGCCAVDFRPRRLLRGR